MSRNADTADSRLRRRQQRKTRSGVDMTVSIPPSGSWGFRYFLIALMSISIGSACIENGLHPLLLLLLPVMLAAVARKDYRLPFLWRERVTLILFVIYVVIFSAGIVLVWGRISLPLFMVYFTFGILLVRVLLPLTDRNISQVIALTVGMILINCILTNHLIFGLMMPIYLFVLMATLLLFHLARNKTWSGEPAELPVGKKLTETWYGKLTVYTTVVLVFTVVAFVIFPRPFLVIPGLRTAMASAGGLGQLEQRISYRQMTGMAGRNRIAFKVKVEQGDLPATPYWRGRILDRFDGKTWYASENMRGMGHMIRANPSETLDYRFIPYRLHSKIVYVTGLPVEATGRRDKPLYISSGGEVVVDSPFLFADSYFISTVDRPIPASYRSEPATTDTTGVTPRIEELAQEWTVRLASPRDKATALISKLRSQYTYRLQAPVALEGSHPLEYFLFESRTGNCEQFAGALCLMLRAVGIPARVVEGFAGVEKTDVPDEFIVRFARAHAWVEALLEGRYWTSLDATPAIGDSAQNRLWRWIMDTYDNLENLWIKQVVYFDRADQATVFRGLGRLLTGRISVRESIAAKVGPYLKPALALSGLLVVLALALYAFRPKKTDFPTLYLSTMKELSRNGVLSTVHPWHEQNSAEILERSPASRDALSRFMGTYLQGRFGASRSVSVQELERAKQDLLQSIEV